MGEARKQMHQTTIRFDSELWRRIDAESGRIGVSAAQYIRDATLIRLTSERSSDLSVGEGRSNAAAAISAAEVITTESQAVWAQARQARQRARTLRDASHRLSDLRSLRAWAGSNLPRPSAGGEQKKSESRR